MHLDDVIAELAWHRADDLTDLSVEDCVLKLRHVPATAGPAQFTACRAAASVEGRRLRQVCEGLTLGQCFHDGLGFFFGFNQDMPCINLFFAGGQVTGDLGFQQFPEDFGFKDGPNLVIAHARNVDRFSEVVGRELFVAGSLLFNCQRRRRGHRG